MTPFSGLNFVSKIRKKTEPSYLNLKCKKLLFSSLVV